MKLVQDYIQQRAFALGVLIERSASATRVSVFS
jgi:hypothetical protein